MKVLFVFLCAALMVSCGDDASSEEQAQARFHAEETDFKKDGKIVRKKTDNKPLTGVVFWNHDNGQLAYERNFSGLVECYILAIPFFGNTLLSTIFFSYISFFSINYLCKKYTKI